MKILTACLLLLISNLLFAQQFSVSISENMELEGKPPLKVGDSYFALDVDSKAQFGYTFKLNKAKYSAKLLKYDKKLKIVKEVKLADGERVYGPFAPMLKIVNDKILFLYYQLAGEDDNIKLMVGEVDASTLALSQADEFLSIEQKNIGLQQVMDLTTSYKFILTPSPDNSKILALWSSGINNQVYFSVLDKNFKKIREAAEVVNGQTTIEVANACVDNGGNVFISYYGKKNSNRILISKPGSKTSDLEIKFGSGEPYKVFVFPSIADNSIKLAGTYKESTDNLAGVFSQVLTTSNLQLSAVNKTVFPEQLVEQFDNDGWANSKPKKYGLFANLNIIPVLLADGTVDLVGEFRRVQMGTKASFMISGDILDIHFKKEGVSFSRIPKARVSAGSDIGDSFFPVPYKNQVIIFYNDHELNVKQDITKSPSRSDNYKNSVLVAASIATDGTIKRDILIDLSKEDYLPIAETLQRLSLSSVLIPIRRIKGFGKVTDDFKWGTVEIK